MASIQSLSSAVLNTAKTKSLYINWLHVLTFLCASLSIFTSGTWLYVLAIVALISQLMSWLISITLKRKKSLGQELLRLNILQKSFGTEFAIDIAYLKSKVSKQEFQKAKEFETPNYYATEDENHEKRLIDILQESCFWSQHLYQSCQNSSIKASIILGVFIIIIVVTGLTIIETDTNYTIPRLSVLFLMFFPLWNLIENAISYGLANRKLTAIDQQLSNINYDTPSILSIFAEYNVVTSNTPLIPQRIYENEQEKLNELWCERSANKSSNN